MYTLTSLTSDRIWLISLNCNARYLDTLTIKINAIWFSWWFWRTVFTNVVVLTWYVVLMWRLGGIKIKNVYWAPFIVHIKQYGATYISSLSLSFFLLPFSPFSLSPISLRLRLQAAAGAQVSKRPRRWAGGEAATRRWLGGSSDVDERGSHEGLEEGEEQDQFVLQRLAAAAVPDATTRPTVVATVAAFLESNSFPRVLATLQSEAKLKFMALLARAVPCHFGHAVKWEDFTCS